MASLRSTAVAKNARLRSAASPPLHLRPPVAHSLPIHVRSLALRLRLSHLASRLPAPRGAGRAGGRVGAAILAGLARPPGGARRAGASGHPGARGGRLRRGDGIPDGRRRRRLRAPGPPREERLRADGRHPPVSRRPRGAGLRLHRAARQPRLPRPGAAGGDGGPDREVRRPDAEPTSTTCSASPKRSARTASTTLTSSTSSTACEARRPIAADRRACGTSRPEPDGAGYGTNPTPHIPVAFGTGRELALPAGEC